MHAAIEPATPRRSIIARSCMVVTLVLLLVFIAANLWPRKGPPPFRYTGSDPAREVTKLGWPMALAVYDENSGLHIGPMIWLVVPPQAFVVVAGLLATALIRRSRR